VRFHVLTLFPEIPRAFFESSIMAKAVARGIVSYNLVNVRDFAFDRHRKCDDGTFGGGAGMLMLPEPLSLAIESVGVKPRRPFPEGEGDPGPETPRKRVVYVTPSGRPFTQGLAQELAREDELVFISGRYEGIDQRVIDAYVDDEISIGDYVMSSGELAATVIVDAVYRLLDGVISSESLEEESFSDGLLEYPQYTRPEIFRGVAVPEVLLSGHHENIRRWRLRKRVEKTLCVRPELIDKARASGLLTGETEKIIKELRNEHGADPENRGGPEEGRGSGV